MPSSELLPLDGFFALPGVPGLLLAFAAPRADGVAGLLTIAGSVQLSDIESVCKLVLAPLAATIAGGDVGFESVEMQAGIMLLPTEPLIGVVVDIFRVYSTVLSTFIIC